MNKCIKLLISDSVVEGRKPQIASSEKDVRSVEELKSATLTIGATLTALAGSRVQLSCPADGFPKPSISWQRNGEALETSDESGDSLVITKLRVGDQGIYTCTATNVFGFDSSSSSYTVLGKATIYKYIL